METLRFIESNVMGVLDLLSVKIIVPRMVKSVAETQEHTLPSMDVKFGRALTRRESIHATTKYAKQVEIGTLACTYGDGRKLSVAARNTVGEEHKMC